MIRLIKATGEEIDLTGREFNLKFAQTLVGGWIEAKKLGKTKKYMLMDEEGKFKNLSYNEAASHIYRKYYDDDLIVGDVIITDEMR